MEEGAHRHLLLQMKLKLCLIVIPPAEGVAQCSHQRPGPFPGTHVAMTILMAKRMPLEQGAGYCLPATPPLGAIVYSPLGAIVVAPWRHLH